MVNILLVSSNADSLTQLSSIFSKKKDIKAVNMDSGYAALQIIKEKPYDLVIADTDLPDMSGIEFARKLITLNPYVNCAMISGLMPDDFHDVTEGLGIIMQLPRIPGKADAEKLLEHLNKIIQPCEIKQEEDHEYCCNGM